MPTAQDHAFLTLARRRNLLPDDTLRRGHELLGQSQTPLAQVLVAHDLLPSNLVAELLRDLQRAQFVCTTCRARARYDQLAPLPDLRCPHDDSPLQLLLDDAPDPHASRAASHRPGPLTTSGTSPHLRTIGPYTVQRELGRGAHGVVYLVTRAGLEREFALKTLPAREATDPELVERFRFEAAVTSKLRDPGIVPVIDVGRDGETHYFVMEYVTGPTLKDHLRTQGALPPARAASLMGDLAGSLAVAHAQGVIHRDLKPANVLLERGRPRIADFGLARDRSLLRSMTETGDLVGTPYYMSPEQLRGDRQLTAKADVFALGVVLYELLTGAKPFPADSLQQLVERVCNHDPPPLPPTVPPHLARACRWALAKLPEERPDAATFAAELCLPEQTPQPASAPEDPSQPRNRRVGLWIALGLALLGAGAAGAVLLRQPPQDAPSAPVEPARSSEELLRAAQETLREACRRGEAAPFAATEELLREAAEGSSEGRLALGWFLLRRGQFDASEEVLGPILETEREAQLAQALGRERAGQRRSAEVALQALGREDDAVGAVARAAWARLTGADASEAAREATRLAPELAAGWIERAYSVSRENVQAAELAADRALTEAPDDPRAHGVVAELHMLAGRGEEGREALERASGLIRPYVDPGLERLWGLLELSEGNALEAQARLEQALSWDAHDVAARLHLGFAFEAQGVLEARDTAWLAAWAADREEVQRALTRWWTEEDAERVAWVWRLPARVRALQGVEDPLPPERPLSPGLRERVRGWIPELSSFGVDELERSARGRHMNPRLLESVGAEVGIAGRAVIADLLVAQDHPEAEAFVTALPEDAQGLRLRGQLHWRRGELEEARRWYARVEELEEASVEVWCARAERALLEQRHEDVWTPLWEALSRDPEHRPSARALLHACLVEGNQDVAKAALRFVLGLEGRVDARAEVWANVVAIPERQTRFAETWTEDPFATYLGQPSAFGLLVALEALLLEGSERWVGLAEEGLRRLARERATHPLRALCDGLLDLSKGRSARSTVSDWERYREQAPGCAIPERALRRFEDTHGGGEELEGLLGEEGREQR